MEALTESSSPCSRVAERDAECPRNAAAIVMRTMPPTATSTGVRRPASRSRCSSRGRRLIELPRYRHVERPAAPVEHARELAEAPVRDRDSRTVVSDGDGNERPAALVAIDGSRERTQKRERLQVDPDDLEAGPPTRLEVPL